MGKRPGAITTSVPTPKVPERTDAEDLKAKWGKTWKEDGVHVFDRTTVREQVYLIDIPLPVASGPLHIDHVLSYTYTDVVARFQRMTDEIIFYPMG